jgi:type I restriction enzyme M protein
MGRHMFEQAFRNIDNVLRKEAGCTTELDYTEQTSWLLFLKYLDGLEQDKAAEAQLEGKKHTYILDKPYRWESWAAPKGKDGKLDHNTAMTGDDLRAFVNQKLFPYLHGFTQKASGPNTIEYKIGQIFGEIRNKITSGYNLREIIDDIDELRCARKAKSGTRTSIRPRTAVLLSFMACSSAAVTSSPRVCVRSDGPHLAPPFARSRERDNGGRGPTKPPARRESQRWPHTWSR